MDRQRAMVRYLRLRGKSDVDLLSRGFSWYMGLNFLVARVSQMRFLNFHNHSSGLKCERACRVGVVLS